MDFLRAFADRPFLWCLLLLCVPASNAWAADVVVQWNEVLSEVLQSDTQIQNPGMASRSTAMVNLAMYDAINGISPTYQPFYSYTDAAPAGASDQAAAVQAGFHVLTSIYPGQQELLETRRSALLDRLSDAGVAADALTAGTQFGNYVGRTVVSQRASDGYANMVHYEPTDAPGRWQPDPLNPAQQAWGPEWGQIQTFAISSTADYMPPAMPSLTDSAYTDAFNEVKALGAKESKVRTQEQTDIGQFWAYDRLGMGTPLRMYNRVLRTIAEGQGNTLTENARLFAMASTSMADAGIAAWDSKFTYDFWRPVTGIREADGDGNPDTLADPTWEPLGAPGGVLEDGTVIPNFTPPFPTYVSGHASFGGALFESLVEFYQTDEVSFEVRSEEMPAMVRSFDRFSDAMRENGRSRVYLGIHWNFDDVQARELGQDVARAVSADYFHSVPEPGIGGLLLTAGMGFLAGRRRRHA